jgi:hypothetical protein
VRVNCVSEIVASCSKKCLVSCTCHWKPPPSPPWGSMGIRQNGKNQTKCPTLWGANIYSNPLLKVLLNLPTKSLKFIAIDRFHLTSRRPYWCTKRMKWRPYWCTVRELALSYSNISYCFTTPLGPPIT